MECPICNKIFKHKSSFSRHKAYHTEMSKQSVSKVTTSGNEPPSLMMLEPKTRSLIQIIKEPSKKNSVENQLKSKIENNEEDIVEIYSNVQEVASKLKSFQAKKQSQRVEILRTVHFDAEDKKLINLVINSDKSEMPSFQRFSDEASKILDALQVIGKMRPEEKTFFERALSKSSNELDRFLEIADAIGKISEIRKDEISIEDNKAVTFLLKFLDDYMVQHDTIDGQTQAQDEYVIPWETSEEIEEIVTGDKKKKREFDGKASEKKKSKKSEPTGWSLGSFFSSGNQATNSESDNEDE